MKSIYASKKRKIAEFTIERIIFFLGIISIITVALIFLFLFRESAGAFKTLTLRDLFMVKNWYPNSNPGVFGIIPLILGSLITTFTAIIIAIPIGIGSAIFIAELAPPKLRDILKVIVEFLSAIPSVVLGFLGIVVLSSVVRNVFELPTGFTVLTGAILLALMALPTIISISDDAIRSLPKDYREASLALGANKWETIVHVLFPAASSGIIASIMLGIGRAIGETMTVLMVTGNAAVIPNTVLSSARTMTATIAAEMGDTVRNGTHYHTLFFIGMVLLFMTSVINIIADRVLSRVREGE